MPRDTELDRLKGEQDLAFSRKQAAYQAMDTAWKRRAAAREVLDRAHDAKQRAYDVQNAAWEYYQSVRASNGPRIDSLNEQQERAFENMKDSFERASDAYESRNGEMASSYAADGRRYKQEAQDCVADRRRLVQEIRDAKAHHESTRPDFQYAKSQFDSAKRDHDQARNEHQRTQEEFKQAKGEFDAAATAFKKRLEQVRAESRRRQGDKRSIAERAGVPYQYLDNVWVSKQRDGVTNIYFGGVGKPNGPGHGHYVMQADGTITYRRDPFNPHGSENFTNQEEKSRWMPSGSQPPYVGVVDGTDHVVSFKTKDDQDRTIIADGDYSDDKKGFDAAHNDYGRRREGDGYFSEDRGHYTGPGH